MGRGGQNPRHASHPGERSQTAGESGTCHSPSGGAEAGPLLPRVGSCGFSWPPGHRQPGGTLGPCEVSPGRPSPRGWGGTVRAGTARATSGPHPTGSQKCGRWARPSRWGRRADINAGLAVQRREDTGKLSRLTCILATLSPGRRPRSPSRKRPTPWSPTAAEAPEASRARHVLPIHRRGLGKSRQGQARERSRYLQLHPEWPSMYASP